MTITIHCSMQGHRGRPIEVGPDEPVRIRVRSSHAGEAMVTFLEEDGRCRFTVDGDAPVRFNGETVAAGAMGESDQLEVGTMRFLVQLATTPIAAATPVAEDGHAAAQASIEVQTDRFRAQASPLGIESSPAIHEQTETVPIPGRAARPTGEEQEETVAMPGGSGGAMPPPVAPAAGDRRRRRLALEEETAAVAERNRRVRRLSASQDSVVSSAAGRQGRGILKKMANMFRRSDQQAGRLRELLDERDALFREAGRLSLGGAGGLGLPADLVPRLLRGETVTLDPDAVNRVEVQRFAERCKLLRLLDAEVYALREEMGMAAPETELPGDEKLRTERQDFEERAFQASDIVLTQDLDGAAEEASATDSYADEGGEDPAPAPAPETAAAPEEKPRPPRKKEPGKLPAGESRVSGRRRAMRRRRRR